jgi:SAM-dependent methyltransferase
LALTAVDHEFFAALYHAGDLPARPSVLELGESEWYGDIPPEGLEDLVREHAPPAKREALAERLAQVLGSDAPERGWALAKVFYAALLDYSRITAIDFHGTPAALRIDLNEPTGIEERFDLVINGGTAEHVFDLRQFFRTCHELTRPGGLMVHALPFRGWLEHGFYSFNPTLFWDLAAVNGYRVALMAYAEIDPPRMVPLGAREAIADMARAGELGANALLYAALVKPREERPFAVPMQGIYAGTLSDEMTRAWYEVR